MGCRTEPGTDRRNGLRRSIRDLLIASVALCLSLVLGPGLAAASSKPHNSGSRTIGTCTVVLHPTAAVHTQCAGASLENAPLSHADLAYADLTKANLTGADLASANLTQAALGQAVLTGAVLTGVKWSSTTCPDGANSDNVNGSCSGHLSTVSFVSPPPTNIAATGFQSWPFVLTGTVLIGIGLLLLQLARTTGWRRPGRLLAPRLPTRIRRPRLP